ncbi:MAG: 15-cis-phytoene synthase [Phycisphaerales bacterium]|jgi:phytoene synthase|nr:15-cis-phytoene synthase [Phycisphaerales bacterium]
MAAVVDESESRAAFAAARKLCRRERGGSLLATFFLPRAKRDGVYAVWAFARLIEQAVAAEAGSGGECCGGESKVAPLLKSRIDAMYDAPIELPLPQFRDDSQWTMLATIDTVRRFDIPRRLWHELIDGLVAANGVQRFATWRSLDAHLAATGGNIGRIIAAVLGATHSDAAGFAASIGQAARLTSILRDLAPDLSRNRIRLPLEDLARFRYSEREMLAKTANGHLSTLVRHAVERAREMLRTGAAGTCWLDGDGSRMAAAVFMSLQIALLDTIELDPGALLRDDFRSKPASLASQLRQLPRAWRIARRQAADPLPNLR